MRVKIPCWLQDRGESPPPEYELWGALVCVCTTELVELMYPVFTRMPGESYRRQLRSLLWCLYDVLRALICWFSTSAVGLLLFETVPVWKFLSSLEAHQLFADTRQTHRQPMAIPLRACARLAKDQNKNYTKETSITTLDQKCNRGQSDRETGFVVAELMTFSFQAYT